MASPRSALADRVKKRKVKEAADEYEASFGKGIPDSKKRKEAGGGEDGANAETGREGRPIGCVAFNAKKQEAPSAKASAADVNGEAGRDNDDDGPRRRTVILGGFSTSSSQAVVKLVKSLGKQRRKGSSATPVEKIHMPAPINELPLAELRSHGCRGSMCAVLYTSEAEAAVAVAALHRTTLDAPGKPELWGRMLAGEGASPRRWRVIVRNLPFTTKAEQLMEVMGEVGFVWELNVPRTAAAAPAGQAGAHRRAPDRMRGFAFASYTCKAHAEAAVERLNGRQIDGLTIAVDWAIAKDRYDDTMTQRRDGDTEGERAQKIVENGDSDKDSEDDGDDGSLEDDDGNDDDNDESISIEEVTDREHDMMKSAIHGIMRSEAASA